MKFPHKLKQIRLVALVCVIVCSGLVSAQTSKLNLPPANPTSPVNDLANVIDPATKQQLDRILKNFEGLTGAQIAVATVPSLQERSIEEFANELARAWGVGAKQGPNKDKGALILLAPNERKSRMEVGYGLEGDLPDGLAGEQLRRMRPYFQQGQYAQGLNVGVRTLIDTLAEKWNVNVEGIDRQYAYHPAQQDAAPPAGALICFVIGLLLFLLLLYFASHRGGGGGGNQYRRSSGWYSAPIIFNSGGGDYGSGSWGNSSGGGGGGGGSDWGGFGGGDSGGGGASDSW